MSEIKAIDLFCKENNCSKSALDKYIALLSDIILKENVVFANKYPCNWATDLRKAHKMMGGEVKP